MEKLKEIPGTFDMKWLKSVQNVKGKVGIRITKGTPSDGPSVFPGITPHMAQPFSLFHEIRRGDFGAHAAGSYLALSNLPCVAIR